MHKILFVIAFITSYSLFSQNLIGNTEESIIQYFKTNKASEYSTAIKDYTESGIPFLTFNSIDRTGHALIYYFDTTSMKCSIFSTKYPIRASSQILKQIEEKDNILKIGNMEWLDKEDNVYTVTYYKEDYFIVSIKHSIMGWYYRKPNK